MEILLVKILTTLVQPPGIIILVALAGLLLLHRRRRLAAVLLTVATVGLYALSLPVTSRWMLTPLERYPSLALDQPIPAGVGAIVVLGGGQYTGAPEYPQDNVSEAALARIQYAAHLHRQTELPILVTGGRVYDEPHSEAELLKRSLEVDFRVPVAWTEDRARNTAENARYSQALLAVNGVNKVLLVTHARHMGRAVAVFERAGLTVVPAPTRYSVRASVRKKWRFMDWLPSASSLSMNAEALHEHLGHLWYEMRY